MPFDENIIYQPEHDRWVILDNDMSKAVMMKQIYPYQPVFLYDPDKNIYTQYKIKYTHKKKIIKNGRIVSIDTEEEI